jgi:hypothetical protein
LKSGAPWKSTTRFVWHWQAVNNLPEYINLKLRPTQ